VAAPPQLHLNALSSSHGKRAHHDSPNDSTRDSQRMRLDDQATASIISQSARIRHYATRPPTRSLASKRHSPPDSHSSATKKHKPPIDHQPPPHSPPTEPPSLTDDNPAPAKDLSPYVHIIILGTDGFLYDPLDTFLTDTLKIPQDKAEGSSPQIPLYSCSAHLCQHHQSLSLTRPMTS
jgi:hypothetical protein